MCALHSVHVVAGNRPNDRWTKCREYECQMSRPSIWLELYALLNDPLIGQKHLGRSGVGDKADPSLGQTGPAPGTNRTCPLGQVDAVPAKHHGCSLLNCTGHCAACPIRPWDKWDPPKVSENAYVFCVYRSFSLPS